MVETDQHIWEILKTVPDPEIPNLSILDLGVVRDVLTDDENRVTVVITPTYSGCPAMDMIEVMIKSALQEAGFDHSIVKTVLTPAWTTDWITDEGKKKLLEAGIAPPQGKADKRFITGDFENIPCPQCESSNTEMISQFGSTACKSLFRCVDCREPFDYFKCH